MPRSNPRKNDLAIIHIAKKQLNLNDENYRAVLEGVTGKTSSADLTASERDKVIAEFKTLGFKTLRKTKAKAKRNEYEQATSRLMIAIWNRLYQAGKVKCGTVNCFHTWIANQVRPAHADLPKTKHPDTLPTLHVQKLIKILKQWEARSD